VDDRFLQMIPSVTIGSEGRVTRLALDAQGNIWYGRITYGSHSIEWTMMQSDRK